MKFDNKVDRLLEHTSCPVCPSSDAFAIWEDSGQTKHGHCFSCGYHSRDPYRDLDISPGGNATSVEDTHTEGSAVLASLAVRAQRQRQEVETIVTIEQGSAHPCRGLGERGIDQSTCERFNVRVGVSPADGDTPIYTLFPRYREGELVGWKKKVVNKETGKKDYLTSGGSNVDLFGKQVCKPGGKKIFITEGEEDALCVYQVLVQTSSVQGWEPNVVSLPDGCSSVRNTLTKHYDFLNEFDDIVIVFDTDEPGRKARDEALKMFSGKSSFVDLPLKDANEMVLAGRDIELKWLLLTGSKKYQPDGIVNPGDLWERYKDESVVESYDYPDFLPELNHKLAGARPGSIITITSGSGCGKTEFLMKLLHNHYTKTDLKIAGMFIEQDVTETMRALISTHLGKRLQLPEVKVSEEEERNAFNELFASHRISFYDYFGGMDDTNLMSKLKYLAVTGHKVIFLDHLNIIVSEFADQGGERERIDTIMTKLAKFAKEYGIILYLVVHLVKTSLGNTPFEQGARPSLDDLRGSGSIKQLSWDVIALSRNQQHEDPYTANVVEVISLKCRSTGRTGVCDYIHFDDVTGLYTKIDKPGNFHLRVKSKMQQEEDLF